jgi:hypothetical protein
MERIVKNVPGAGRKKGYGIYIKNRFPAKHKGKSRKNDTMKGIVIYPSFFG